VQLLNNGAIRCEKVIDLYHDDNEFVLLSKYEKLETQLKEAEKIIDFYADIKSWHGTTIDNSDRNRIESENFTRRGGKKAREYKTKYNKDKG